MRVVIGGLAGLLAITGLVAGCGGDSSPTKAEFVKQANAICKRADGEKTRALEDAFEKLTDRNQPVGRKAQKEIVETVALPPVAQMTEELAELDPPSSDEEKVDTMVTSFEEEVEKIESDPGRVVSGELGEFEAANRRAKEYGVRWCSII